MLLQYYKTWITKQIRSIKTYFFSGHVIDDICCHRPFDCDDHLPLYDCLIMFFFKCNFELPSSLPLPFLQYPFSERAVRFLTAANGDKQCYSIRREFKADSCFIPTIKDSEGEKPSTHIKCDCSSVPPAWWNICICVTAFTDGLE